MLTQRAAAGELGIRRLWRGSMLRGLWRSLFPGEEKPKGGPSMPLVLARRGWVPHRFGTSTVVVFLPPEVGAAFDPEGVLHGTTNGTDTEFSATLHGGFEGSRASALDFVAHLAEKKGRPVTEAGTDRYFFDPTA